MSVLPKESRVVLIRLISYLPLVFVNNTLTTEPTVHMSVIYFTASIVQGSEIVENHTFPRNMWNNMKRLCVLLAHRHLLISRIHMISTVALLKRFNGMSNFIV